MKCPECNTDVEANKRYCPNCGAPMPKVNKHEHTSEELKLSRGMMVFIIVGLSVLIGFGIIYNVIHSNDPEYLRTQIEPDSALREKAGPSFDTVAIDTAKRDSIKRAEKLEAEKLLNSIRRKKQDITEQDSETDNNDNTGSETQNSETSTDKPSSSDAPKQSEPSVPTPKVESIGND